MSIAQRLAMDRFTVRQRRNAEFTEMKNQHKFASSSDALTAEMDIGCFWA